MKNVLITGAGGFAGSHLLELILESGLYKPYVTTYENSDFLTKLLPTEQIFQGDLTDYQFTEKLIIQSKPDYIFHLAALSIVENSVEKAQLVLTSNLVLQYNLLEAVKNHAPHARFIAVCSANEYGKVEDSEVPISEDAPLRPLNPYAVSKISQEYLSLQYHYSYGLDVVILRPFNHTGERQIDSFVIPSLAKQIAQIELGRQDSLTIGNLEAVRDFTDVKDMVKAYLLAAEKGVAGEVYNIGSGTGYTVQEILDMLIKLSSKEINIVQDDAKMRPSDVPTLIADNAKFSNLTGWNPEINIQATLERVLNYYREELK